MRSRCASPSSDVTSARQFLVDQSSQSVVDQSAGGTMRHALPKTMAICLWLALLPATAYAQASITGIVKDSSGAVLPGVLVEASSPALIEKSRSTVTDASGQYQIIQLAPGTYAVSFTLQGFNIHRRDGIELSGSFVANVNADMKVGDVAETITVTGQT